MTVEATGVISDFDEAGGVGDMPIDGIEIVAIESASGTGFGDAGGVEGAIFVIWCCILDSAEKLCSAIFATEGGVVAFFGELGGVNGSALGEAKRERSSEGVRGRFDIDSGVDFDELEEA